MPLESLPTWIAGLSGSFADADCGACDHAGAAASRTSAIAYAAAMRLKIKRLDSTVSLPTYATEEAAGFDLAASQDVRLAPGQIALVPTGLVIEVPAGHFLAIIARSSTPLKRGLMVANGVGVVDSDYCGPKDEIKIEVYNFTAKPVAVKRGDRLAQGVIVPFVRAEWTETDAPSAATRGGFGATG